MKNQTYHANLDAIVKPQLDGFKSATRLAFEAALHKTEGQHSKVAGKVFRKVMGPAGVDFRAIRGK